MKFSSLEDFVGNTPLVPIRRLNPNPRVELFAKLERANPGGQTWGGKADGPKVPYGEFKGQTIFEAALKNISPEGAQKALGYLPTEGVQAIAKPLIGGATAKIIDGAARAPLRPRHPRDAGAHRGGAGDGAGA